MSTYTGQPLYNVPGLFDPQRVVYQTPNDLGTNLDLTPDQEDRMATARNTFAGGLFAQDPTGQTGYQVRDTPVEDGPFAGRYFVPLQPSGMVAAPEGGGDPNQPEGMGAPAEEGTGAYTLAELMGFESALRGANFGNARPFSVFDIAQDRGGNTFDIDLQGPYGNLFGVMGQDRELMPLTEAVRASDGQPLTREHQNEIIRARLAGIDESN